MNKDQRGVTMLVVLILLSAMLLGGMAFARLTEVGTLASGNSAYREASLQASEVGLNSAYEQVRNGIANEDVAVPGAYWPTIQAIDEYGMPQVDFDAAPQVVVGAYTARFVIERLCTVAVPTAPLRECLVKQIPQTESADASREKVDPPTSRQFRVTIRVTGPKDTRTWVQSLITKG